jgi:polyribonucleotide nucleotidyltransferase
VQPGTRYAAKVVKMMDYGAFVELTGGTQGLLHISEIAVEKVRCGSQAFSLLA